jgi:hypothetical protein
MIRFLASHSLDGPAELIDNEAKLFKALPVRLQEDLHDETRGPMLCQLSSFYTLALLSSRCVRQMCHEMYDKLAVEGESLFSEGDACDQLYMIHTGGFTYFCDEEILSVTPRQICFPRYADDNPGADKMYKGQFLCEASFWTDWEHVGELIASDQFGRLLMFDVAKFAQVVLHYRIARVHASRYAHHFVWRLNRCHGSDITGFDFDLNELDKPAYRGTPEDHFAFISHYKVESGTEATLMRDTMSSMAKSDITHEANEYMSGFFVDSEDLVDLARLQAHVEGSGNLIILLTPGLLLRPWCLVEFVTAVRNDVNLVPVEIQRPGLKYIYPNDEWYTSFRKGKLIPKESMHLLFSVGITLEEVEDAIRQIFLRIALPFSPHKSGSVRRAEIADIMKRCSSRFTSGKSNEFDARPSALRESPSLSA